MQKKNFRILDLSKKEDALELFKIIGSNASMSDLAIINGGQITDDGYGSFYTMNDANLYDRTKIEDPADFRVPNAPSYLNSLDEDQAYHPMDEGLKREYKQKINEVNTFFVLSVIPSKLLGKLETNKTDIDDFGTGIRPVIDLSSDDTFIWENAKRNAQGILEVYYGEYPQQSASIEIQQELEGLYQNGLLASTEKKYTIVTNEDLDNTDDFKDEEYQEYITQNGRKFIRAKYNNPESYGLSNGTVHQANSKDAIWIEVTPIKWYIDEKTQIAISDRILLAGCPFKNSKTAYDGDFDETDISNVLYQMSKDIIPSKIHRNSMFVDSTVVETIIKDNRNDIEDTKTR